MLADRVNALNSASLQPNRTDFGLYLADTDNAQDIALPLPYRRVEIPAHYYASTCFDDLAGLDSTFTRAIMYLLHEQNAYHVSGHSPLVLWQANHLELRIPLVA